MGAAYGIVPDPMARRDAVEALGVRSFLVASTHGSTHGLSGILRECRDRPVHRTLSDTFAGLRRGANHPCIGTTASDASRGLTA